MRYTSSVHYSFGMMIPERSFSSEDYRYGFNGMERAPEISPGAFTTEFRELDTRLGGRWWSKDPIVKPWESPYAGFSNNPIFYIDPSGLDPAPGGETNKNWNEGGGGKADDAIHAELPEVPIIYNKTAEMKQRYEASKSMVKDLFLASSDNFPTNIANGLLRSNYLKEANDLYKYYDNDWKFNPSNQIGIDKRYDLKLQTRADSWANQGKIFEILEPIERKPLLNANGDVTHFWYTRPSVNYLAKFTKYSGYLGMATSGIRIITAEDKILETSKVALGFSAGWLTMKVTAPISAEIGIWATGASGGNLLVGIVAGGGSSIIFGGIGAFGGEKGTQWIYNKFNTKE